MKLPEVTKDRPPVPTKKVAASVLLFILGFGFVLLCVYFLFGKIAFESFDVSTAYQQILTGRLDSQRMSAVQWVQSLQAREASTKEYSSLRPTEAQSRSLWSRYLELEQRTEAPTEHEKSLRAALPTLVSFSQSPASAAALIAAYVQKLPVDRNPDLQVYLLLSLRRALDASETPADSLLIEALNERLKGSDADLRSAAAFSLAGIDELNNFGPLSLHVQANLRALLADQNAVVRLNGALALSQLGDAMGNQQLIMVLKKVNEQSVVDLESLRLVVAALKKKSDPEASKILKEMSESHKNLKVRQLVKEFNF